MDADGRRHLDYIGIVTDVGIERCCPHKNIEDIWADLLDVGDRGRHGNLLIDQAA